MAINTRGTEAPEDCHTLNEFIAIGQSLDRANHYGMFSFKEIVNGSEFIVSNILDDYLAELKELSVNVNITSEEAEDYMYNPKKLSYKLYKTTELYWVILKINDIADVHEFTLDKKKLKLLEPKVMRESLDTIYNANKYAIDSYNYKHNNVTKDDEIKIFK